MHPLEVALPEFTPSLPSQGQARGGEGRMGAIRSGVAAETLTIAATLAHTAR
jgi:hypothetical protein